MKNNRALPALVVLLSLLSVAASAQAPAPAAPVAPPSTQEIRAEQERALAMAERRTVKLKAELQQVQDKMVGLDGRIESGVQELLAELEGIKDSKESKTRIANLKEDVMKALKGSLDVYKREREKRLSSMNASYAPVSDADLKADADKLAARGEQRVEQILQLAETLTKDEGFDKYEQYYDGDGDWDRQVSEDWKQNHRESSKTAQAHEKIMDALQQSIEDLKKEAQRLEQARASAKSDESLALLDEQIRNNQDLLRSRRNQVRELLNDTGGQGRELGRQEAFQFEQLVNEMVEGLKKDFRELYRLATERDQVRASLRNVQSQARQLSAALAAPAAP